MCTTPHFHHTCNHQTPLSGDLERCQVAEQANLPQCTEVREEIIEDPYPCPECFVKKQDEAVEEQIRTIIATSADDFTRKEEETVEEQIRVAIAASTNDFTKKEEKEVEEQLRIAMAASLASETDRAKRQEEAEIEKTLRESMDGISLNDRWEVDLEGEDMAKILRESYGEYRKQQEDEFRKRGFLGEDGRVPEGEWTRRETIYDRVGSTSDGSMSAGGNGSRPILPSNRPGPSRPGPAHPHNSHPQQALSLPIENPEERPETRPPPPPPSISHPKRLQEYPPNIGPSGHRHPLLLTHYIGCSHDITSGIDYSKTLSPNELNAIRTPKPGKCPKCGGTVPPTALLDAEKGKGKAGETPGTGVVGDNNILSPEPEVERERELTPAELRAKRLAMMEKGKHANSDP